MKKNFEKILKKLQNKKKLTTIIIISIFLFLLLNSTFVKIFKLKEYKKILIKKSVNLEQEIKDLNFQIKNLKTNEKYIELIARKDLNLCKEGEFIYRFYLEDYKND
jgi:cell division protein FtsB